MNRRKLNAGASLVEVMTVILVIAILGGIVFTGARSLMIRAQVSEALSQINRDLETLRSSSVRTSRNATFIVTGENSYRLSYWGGSSAVNKDITLPNGMSFKMQSRNDDGSTFSDYSTLTYTAPFAKTDSGGLIVTVRPTLLNPANKEYDRQLYIIGVTGKVKTE